MPVNKTATTTGESGFTLIDLLFTASLICTIATMALPSLLRARGVAQSASAVATLRVVNSAQLSFAVTCGSGFYSPTFPTLGVAPPAS
jgi:type II secretory pathway pseudopilin PulG